jgi:hypothetical protein
MGPWGSSILPVYHSIDYSTSIHKSKMTEKNKKNSEIFSKKYKSRRYLQNPKELQNLL